MHNLGLVDCSSKAVPQIEAILVAQGHLVQKISLAEAAETNLSAFQAVVISGGGHLFTDPKQAPWLKQQFRFIEALDIPTLGICLGHQAIGLHFGAEIFLGTERRCSETVHLLTAHPLFRGFPPTFPMREDHCEGITLPAGFTWLARSAHYEVEAMACQTKPFYGVQFHPEVSGEIGQKLLGNFCDMI